ncbi:MAG: cation:proton antiporter [Desulfovibrio sp.]|nr:MAG: cation:proton antiporter [Desulfovibrio sp.]
MAIDQAWSLLIVSLAAVALPGLARLVLLPAVVLEILFGVVLGKSLIGLDMHGPWVPFLAELGFMLLMFQAGMEIDFSLIRKQSKAQFGLQLAIFGSTLALAFVAAGLLGQGGFLALVLSTTSLGLVVPSLKEAGLSKTPRGQAMLIAATLADFLTLFAITFFVLFHNHGLDWRFLAPVPLFAGFALLLKLGRLWAWWHPEAAARLLGQEDAQEIGVRLSLALLFLFVALSELVHLEPALGAFMGGALLSFVFREKGHLETKLSSIGYGFLIPIFFINVGLEFDLGNILDGGRLVFTMGLLGCAVLVKVLPSLLFTLTRIPPSQALSAGFLLSSRLSLIIAAAAIGLEQGFLTPGLKDSIVLLAVFTCLLGPTLFKLTSGRVSAGSPPNQKANGSS